MTETTAERRPTHPAVEAVKRHWAFRLAVVLLPAIASSIAAYTSATGDAEDRAAVVGTKADVADDKATVGYKITTAWVTELERRIAQLDAEVTGLKRAVRAGTKRPVAVKVVVNQPAAAAPPPLPATVEKALELEQQQQAKAPPAPEAPKP